MYATDQHLGLYCRECGDSIDVFQDILGEHRCPQCDQRRHQEGVFTRLCDRILEDPNGDILVEAIMVLTRLSLKHKVEG